VTDSIDGALLELLSFYRDVLVVQAGAASALVNEEMRTDVVAVGSTWWRRADVATNRGHRCVPGGPDGQRRTTARPGIVDVGRFGCECVCGCTPRRRETT
jgi:hypothetical protein